MDNPNFAKERYLDNIGELYCMTRIRFKTIKLFFGWKLVREEKDKEYRARILKKIKSY